MSDVDIDICTLGEATLNAATNVQTVEVSREFGLDGERAPGGTAPMLTCLGVTALPAPPTGEGHAEGIVMMPCGPYTAGIIGATDTRSADVVGKMKAGDTALHNTGGDAAKRAKAFAKENNFAILVGNDTSIIVDRENNAITINDANGNQFEMSKANGILMAEAGGAWVQLKDGKFTCAQSGLNLAGAVSIGDASAMPVAHSVPLVTYLTALEAVLMTLATNLDLKLVPTPGVSTGAVTAFVASMVATKLLLPTVFTKAS